MTRRPSWVVAVVRSVGRGAPWCLRSVEVLGWHPWRRVDSLYRDPGVAVGSTLVSGSVAEAGGLWFGGAWVPS